MVKLARLEVNAFRKIRPGTQLRFRTGPNLLLGAAASGKSTLLELVAACATMDFSPFAAEPFDVAFDARFDDDEVEVRLQHRAVGDAFDFALALEIKSGAEDAQGRIRVAAGGTTLKITRGTTTVYEGPLSFDPRQRPGMGALIGLARQVATSGKLDQVRTLLAAGRLARSRRFDEGLDWWRQFTSANGDVLVLPPKEGAARTGISFWVPDEIASAAVAQLDGGESRVEVALASFPPFDAASVAGLVDPRLSLELLEGSGEGPQRLGAIKLSVAGADGTRVAHDKLSYGQQRLFATCLYLAGAPHLAVLDEPSNGLDHAGLAAIAAALGKRQTFASCSNPLLFEQLSFDSGEQLRRAIVLCHADETGGVHYEQPDEKPANAMFRAYKGGWDELAGLLRGRRLW